MFQWEVDARAYTCPDCGAKLAKDHDVLRCENHGAFFAYGPQLLVRVPHESGTQRATLMPWETQGVLNGD